MNRTPFAGGHPIGRASSFPQGGGASPRARKRSLIHRAAIEALERRRLLDGENPFELGISATSGTYEGDWVGLTLDWTNSPYGVPNTIQVGSMAWESGIDFNPDGLLTTVGGYAADNSGTGNYLTISVYNGVESR